MLARLFEVWQTRDKGKALFARAFVPKGTIIAFECQQCRRISQERFALLRKDERDHILRYGYIKADGSHLLPCDEIIYLNHSCNANILDSGRGYDTVVRDIAKGEEATYDYRVFRDRDDLAFQCLCGENSCCGTVRCVYPRPSALTIAWADKINSALKNMDEVRQPLKEKVLF
jgi:SET domain-containing protein